MMKGVKGTTVLCVRQVVIREEISPLKLGYLQPHFLGARHRGIAAPSRRIVQCLNIRLPLVLVNTLETTIVGHQAVDFSLDIGSLGPNATAASESFHLVLQLTKQEMAAVVPSVDSRIDFVGLVDGIDSSLVVPEAMFDQWMLLDCSGRKNSLLDRDIVSDASKFALEANTGLVIGDRVDGVEGGAALGIGVVVVILKQIS
jgi:hypothetical protein